MVPKSPLDLAKADLGTERYAHVERTIVFIDIVESVRLYQIDQDLAVRCWLEFVAVVRKDVLPSSSGRVVKSLGDGLLLEFKDPKDAVSAAFQIHRVAQQQNAKLPAEQQIHLRVGISLGEVIQQADDVYGHDVNVSARLMGLADAGEIVISAAVRDRLTADIDADMEDLGDCYIRHLAGPIRAFRIRPPGRRPVREIGLPSERLKPAIAVLPFDERMGDAQQRIVGEALADEIIQTLSTESQLDVISRLSSRAVTGRGMSSQQISYALGVDFILSGSFVRNADVFVVDLELCDACEGRIIWNDRHHIPVINSLAGREQWLNELATVIIARVNANQISLVRSRPLASLGARTLLTTAVTLMHRLKKRDFDRAKDLLDVLLDRASNEPLVLARIAEWHLMRLQQGWADDLKRESYLASDAALRALDRDPDCSIALMVDGAVQAHFFKKLDLAEMRYDEAIEAEQSNGMAWLRRGTLCSFTDRGERAMEETSKALKLSPLDPSRYLYDALAASACLTAGEDAQALELGRKSLKLNRLHTSTLRVIAVAQWRLGDEKAARASVRELLRLEPDFTIKHYLERVPSADFQIGKEVASVLANAGAPS